jgi:hypothetical protein
MVKAVQFKTFKPYNFVMDLNNVKVKIHLRYNSYLNSYYIDVDKQISGKYVNVINSVALTTGVNLFMQHPQLNLGEFYIIPLKTDLYDKDPTAETIQDYMIWSVTKD